jgi:hypothetical protein
MNADLLDGLDEFREALGAPLVLSPALGALGRVESPDETSLHNVMRYGQVMAADVLVPADVDLERAANVARGIGLFGGVGAYPDWQPRHGLHLDVRQTDDEAPDGTPEDPATWAGRDVNGEQRFFGIAWAFTDDLPPEVA